MNLGLLSQASLVGGAQPEGEPRLFCDLGPEIHSLFADLQDRVAFKILAPATKSAPEFILKLASSARLFSASTNKAIIACERFRQLDGPEVESSLLANEIDVDETIWSVGSTVFNAPNLTGKVNERTAMEAMISHSDNTATDMVLKQAGPARVRAFMAAADLKSTMIFDSTRAIFGYLLGAPNYLTITWNELLGLLGQSYVNPFLNDVETLASSADDLVSFFSRALQGQFFKHRQTLEQFRRVLSLSDITYMVPFPLGASIFGKAGYFDAPGFHALCISGGMYFPRRWVYFAYIQNWDAPALNDPATVNTFFQAVRKASVLLQNALGAA
jgi:beta-lactamase class A